MTRTILTAALAFAISGPAVHANSKADNPVNATEAFSKLKGLVGEWQGDTSHGRAKVKYELIGGGTTLLERESMPGMPDMMTAYHLDGKRLMLTHYCMVGNQPRMEAESYDPSTGELKFRFLDATNLADKGAGHMHNASFRFAGPDAFKTAWEFYENGELKHTESVEYTRVR